MKFSWRNPFFILGLVLLWRIALLVFTVQPIPSNDAFIFDGGIANWLKTGQYINPCIEVGYPISSAKIFSIYPPVYQGALLVWMPLFGAGVVSMITMHLVMFGIAAWLALVILKQFFPGETNYVWVAWLLLGVTFNDRPEDLAHIFGLCSLWLVSRQIAGTRHDARVAGATVLALLFALYTSVIVGAVYFGAGLIACTAAWWSQRKNILLLPYVLTPVLFTAIVMWVVNIHPLWWQGFLENGKKQSVVGGFRVPRELDLVKLVRTVPVFPVTLAALPWVWMRRKQMTAEPWLLVVAGSFAMSLVTLCLAMTFVSPNYVSYTLYLEMIVAAGLLVLVDRLAPRVKWLPRILVLACVLLVSTRAIGMTIWGGVCAWNNSYWQTRKELRVELEPFVNSDAPVVISSAYLYSALEFGVRHPIHSDWYYDRGMNGPDLDLQGMIKLRPPKLVLTQFDYYRGFTDIIGKLRHHPELVTVTLRDETAVRTPDSIPSMQRVVQHISWAPMIVDLDWKKP